MTLDPESDRKKKRMWEGIYCRGDLLSRLERDRSASCFLLPGDPLVSACCPSSFSAPARLWERDFPNNSLLFKLASIAFCY